MKYSIRYCVLAAVTTACLSRGIADETALSLPPGFRARLFADDELAHDVHSLTFNSNGQVVVSGPGYIRTLLDTNDDGRADETKTFAEAPRTGSQGMFFQGRHLICSGDSGLQIFRDDNLDGRADGDPEVFLRINAGGEHDVHAVRRGPDGWWYVIAGNRAGVGTAYATLETSPVKRPESGTLLRLKPDMSGGEILADGFRNAYDFDFSPDGDLFTFDSDGERDVSLPWYRPTRVFQITPGSHAGWISRSWKRPDYFPDMPPVTGKFGRGSPSGVVCYRHTQFPDEYRGALFVLDWTFGRIIALPLQQTGSVCSSDPIEFACGTGQYGFAPTDAAVGPQGDLFISVGGRGTRGGVIRISWEGPSTQNNSRPEVSPVTSTSLETVLNAPQPGSSWSRAVWVPIARRLTRVPFEQAAADTSIPVQNRIRALEILTELYNGPTNEMALQLANSDSPRIRARTIWAVGRAKYGRVPRNVVARYLNDKDPGVVRAALESLSTLPDSQSIAACLPGLARALASKDRFVRAAASLVCSRVNKSDWEQLKQRFGRDHSVRVTAELGRDSRTGQFNPRAIRTALPVLIETQSSATQKLDAVRLVQLGLGDPGPSTGRPGVFDGYAPQQDLSARDLELTELCTALVQMFPARTSDLNHELLRLTAMLAPVNRDLIPVILEGITADSRPVDDIHRLIVLSRIEVERTYHESAATAAALVNLEVKIVERKLNQDSNWEDRITEMYHNLCMVDPAIRKIIVDQPGFGLPGHVLLLSEISQDQVSTAIEHFVRQIRQDRDFEWSSDIIFALGESDIPEHQELIRSQLDNLAVQGAVLMVLSEHPVAGDRERFADGLNSGQINVVRACLKALNGLPPGNTPEELFSELRAARRLMNNPEEFSVRETAVRLLQNNTGRSFGFVFGKKGHRPQPEPLQRWGDWLQNKYPRYQPPGSDAAATRKLLSKLGSVDWDRGDAERGGALYQQLACAKCHGGRRALGPDLQGVARRFSRQDLFTAIVDPGRDVSSRYQTTSIVTTSGRTFSGLVVYESVDGLLLRDAEHKTWRVEAEDIELRTRQSVSLMPAGLLKNRSLQDIADLNRYLQEL